MGEGKAFTHAFTSCKAAGWRVAVHSGSPYLVAVVDVHTLQVVVCRQFSVRAVRRRLGAENRYNTILYGNVAASGGLRYLRPLTVWAG
jgi:phosphoserine phosphatase